MTTVITNPIANIPVNPKSHSLGWAQCWADRLGADINNKCDDNIHNYEHVAIDHGVNFSGSLNMFGGANEDVFNKINNVMKHAKITSLDHDMPDYGAIFKKRLDATSTYSGITERWCDDVSARIASIPTLRQEEFCEELSGITMGDSHTIAFSRRSDHILRNDGATLYGALNTGIKNMFRGMEPFGQITLCFGSIDIRHHVVRNNTNIKKLVAEYVNQGEELRSKYCNDIRYAAPVPVEFEGRRIPKSGFYDGTAFYGCAEQRASITEDFINALVDQGVPVVMPPHLWYVMDKEDYATKHMELSSSFHISPAFYRRNNWGQ